ADSVGHLIALTVRTLIFTGRRAVAPSVTLLRATKSRCCSHGCVAINNAYGHREASPFVARVLLAGLRRRPGRRGGSVWPVDRCSSHHFAHGRSSRSPGAR